MYIWDWTLDFQWKTGPAPKILLLVHNHDKWEKGSTVKHNMYMRENNTKRELAQDYKGKQEQRKAGNWTQMF